MNIILSNDTVKNVMESFLTERKAKGLAKNSLLYYMRENDLFCRWLDEKGITSIQDLTPTIIREYLFELGKRRNSGGVHASYGAIRALLFYYENEFEPENWKNPIRKVKVQTSKLDPLKGISLEEVNTIVTACNGIHKLRDRAIFLFLASSGVRRSELVNLNVQDVDTVTGKVRIIAGKGDKNRVTFISKNAIKALRTYLLTRNVDNEALWLNRHNERLNISTMNYLVEKYSKITGIDFSAHDFRRCFALNCYRQGMEILVISTILGHYSVEVTKRYLNIGEEDLKRYYDKLKF